MIALHEYPTLDEIHMIDQSHRDHSELLGRGRRTSQGRGGMICCVGQNVHTYRMLLYTVPIYAADRSCKSFVALLPLPSSSVRRSTLSISIYDHNTILHLTKIHNVIPKIAYPQCAREKRYSTRFEEGIC